MERKQPPPPRQTYASNPQRGRGATINPIGRFEKLDVEPDDENRDPDEDLSPPETRYLRDSSKSALASNDSPDIGFNFSLNPYRGCLHGCAYCSSGDTAILMADGSTQELSLLRPGDEITGTVANGLHRYYRATRVLAHWETRKPAYRVALLDGTEITTSADHRFLTEQGWKHVAPSATPHRCHLSSNDVLMGFGAVRAAPRVGAIDRRQSDQATEAVEPATKLRVVSVESLGQEIPMFDITTGTEDFIANGVISHNCYARPTHEYLGFSAGLDFETKIMVKEDAPELLRKELASKKWEPQVIMMSGVTDCYQPIERRLRITRRCLEVLLEARNPVGVITKNHLVTRDIDLLAALAEFHASMVHLSIPTLDPELARVLEPRASTPKRRLQAVEKLAAAGIPVGVMIAPVIPGLTDHEIPHILQSAAAAGACTAGWVMLRLPHGVKDVFEQWLRAHRPDRAERVLSRVRDTRDGKLYDSNFGTRGRGTGFYAEQVANLFRVSRERAGLTERSYELSAAAFRPPAHGPQLPLF